VLGELAGPAGAAVSGLVMELVDDRFTSLASPPDFQSCTRDVYATGTAFTLPVILRIATGIAGAAMALHAKGIMHGDLYAHNVLHTAEGECLLGDFGAATFYHRDEPFLLERIEARAFGCLLEELLGRIEGSSCPPALARLAARCLDPRVPERPVFGEILSVLKEIPAR
jgi:serine/threonine protein kinase